jgi:nicotinamidase-related amidase
LKGVHKVNRRLIEGKPVLVAIDTCQTSFARIPQLIDSARENSIPIIFANHASLDGASRVDSRPDEYLIRHRRHSVFYGTELPILLRDLQASTVILAGGVTSVSVHYSFVDAHQYDYFCRVVEDCVAGSSARGHEAALRAMEYMQTGARRQSAEVIAALEAVSDAQSRAV